MVFYLSLIIQQDYKAIKWFINNPSKHSDMAYESELTTQVHNFENFKLQMNFIWDQILNN